MVAYFNQSKRKRNEYISLAIIIGLNVIPIFLAFVFENSGPDKYFAGIIYSLFLFFWILSLFIFLIIKHFFSAFVLILNYLVLLITDKILGMSFINFLLCSIIFLSFVIFIFTRLSKLKHKV